MKLPYMENLVVSDILTDRQNNPTTSINMTIIISLTIDRMNLYISCINILLLLYMCGAPSNVYFLVKLQSYISFLDMFCTPQTWIQKYTISRHGKKCGNIIEGIFFPVRLRNRLLSGGLEPVFRHTEKNMSNIVLYPVFY